MRECCHVSGMCIGNTDGTVDVSCTWPAVLVASATTAVGRDRDRCCVTTGMCAGNTNAHAEPPVQCARPWKIRPDAQTAIGRTTKECCLVSGMCVGNSDSTKEPDVVCPGHRSLKVGAASIAGRSTEACCHCVNDVADLTDAFCVLVRRPLRAFRRPVLTEIYRCNVCSCHETLRRNGRG
jgi:hypothetical protein